MPLSSEVQVYLLTLMGQTTLHGDWSKAHVVDRSGVYGNVSSQLLDRASAAVPRPSLVTAPSLEP